MSVESKKRRKRTKKINNKKLAQRTLRASKLESPTSHFRSTIETWF